MRTLELLPPEPGRIQPIDFAGHYRFWHDGWPGELRLRHVGGRNLRGTLRDYRLDQEFDLTARVDMDKPHQIELVARRFNWQEEQRFTGYLCTRDRTAIAGRTYWKDIPFSFFALRAGQARLGTFRSGDVEPSDFAGTYDFCHDGQLGTVTLSFLGGQRLTGTWSGHSDASELPAAAVVDSAIRHQFHLRVLPSPEQSGGQLPTFTGWLFTRSKSAAAGWAEWPTGRAGFYMLKRP